MKKSVAEAHLRMLASLPTRTHEWRARALDTNAERQRRFRNKQKTVGGRATAAGAALPAAFDTDAE